MYTGVLANVSLLSVLLNTTDVMFNGTTRRSHPELHGSCIEWQDAQHVLFQLANLCFAVSFLTPSSFKYYMLFLRCMLTAGCLLMLLWGGAIKCHPDFLGWYIVFLLVNAAHASYIIYQLYPVWFGAELEEVYLKLFKPLKVPRHLFKEFAEQGQIKDLPEGGNYAVEGSTYAGETVSILLAGRLKVTCESFFLHYITPNQFVDSPEYEAVPPYSEEEDTFQVTLAATEKSRILSWPAKDLFNYLQIQPFLHAVFTNLLGKDITHKMYQMQELLLTHPEYIEMLSGRRSLVDHARRRLSNTISNNNCEREEVRSPSPRVVAGSSSSAGSKVQFESPAKCVHPSIVHTPSDQCSPSQMSFETSV